MADTLQTVVGDGDLGTWDHVLVVQLDGDEALGTLDLVLDVELVVDEDDLGTSDLALDGDHSHFRLRVEGGDHLPKTFLLSAGFLFFGQFLKICNI